MGNFFFIPILVLSFAAAAQNDRVNDYNNTNWAQVFITKAINKKTDWLIEYQWRRADGLKNWQQGLFRTAIQYKFSPEFSAVAGYAEAETFAYGDYPIASAGTFPEHRLFEQFIFKQSVNKLTVTNRFRIEQRWLGRRKAATASREIEDWIFLHRFRYQCRVQLPLWKKSEQQLYTAAADEIFIGAGKNVGVNTFDQNRTFLLMGFRINKSLSFEAGYFNQTLQQGRRVNGNTIMQRNNGVIVSSNIIF